MYMYSECMYTSGTSEYVPGISPKHILTHLQSQDRQMIPIEIQTLKGLVGLHHINKRAGNVVAAPVATNIQNAQRGVFRQRSQHGDQGGAQRVRMVACQHSQSTAQLQTSKLKQSRIANEKLTQQ